MLRTSRGGGARRAGRRQQDSCRSAEEAAHRVQDLGLGARAIQRPRIGTSWDALIASEPTLSPSLWGKWLDDALDAIDANNRATATLFATKHGLMSDP